MHNWYRMPQHSMLQQTMLEPSAVSISKRSTPSVSLKRKVHGSAAGSLGFGGCPLAAHAGHSNSRRARCRDLWSCTTETKSPQEFSFARVTTIDVDILNYIPLARCERFLDNSFIIVTIPIFKRRFVRHHLASPHCRPGQVRAALCLPEKNKPRSSLSGQTATVSLGVSLASGL